MEAGRSAFCESYWLRPQLTPGLETLASGCGTNVNFESLALGVLSRVSGATDREHQTISFFSPTGLYQIGAEGSSDRVQGVFRPSSTFDIRRSTFGIRCKTVNVTASHHTLAFGPFSAVSTPQIARLSSFFSIFRNLLISTRSAFFCTGLNSFLGQKIA